MSTPPDTQHEIFVIGVHMLGGQRSAAHRMKVSERTMRRLIAGESPLHDGFMRDMARALRDHIDDCRAVERRLTPALTSNLADDQPREDGRRTGRRWNSEGAD